MVDKSIIIIQSNGKPVVVSYHDYLIILQMEEVQRKYNKETDDEEF